MGRNQRKQTSGERPKKYKFKENQFTKKKSEGKRLSASSKKLSTNKCPLISETEFSGYCLIDKSIVFKAIEECVSCKICGGDISINCETVYGLSEKINIYCQQCGELSSTRNSAMIGERKNLPEINSRYVYAMRTLGQGLFGAKMFCGIMDLPKPVTVNAYKSLIKNIKDVTGIMAKKSMSSAILEEVQANGSENLTISGDGTWKTRGHTSLVGVCTVIGSMVGKVIDTEVLSSHCRGCSYWDDIRSGKKYEEWSKEHSKSCQKNHSGSAAMMEVVGMQRIFDRSISQHNVHYAHYIGDGDCKTFSAIEKSKPYDDNPIVSKIECVGHMQKRMGARLRKRKLELKGKKLGDGKTISGKGRLTDDLVNKLTIYYGNAIRKHSNSVKDMQRAIWAIFYHKRSTDSEPTHNFCPEGVDSWCPYKKLVAQGTQHANYKHKNVVSSFVMDAVKDIFKDLSMPSLLKRCLGGHTQNANESLNAVIWKLCPKTSGSGLDIVQIAVNEAVILFNNGQTGRLNTMQQLGYRVGINAKAFASESDNRRILSAEIKAENSTLEARRAKKRAKIIEKEAIEEQEGVIYAAGEF